MNIPFRFRSQEGKVAGLEESYEGWKHDHDESMLVRDLEDIVQECIDRGRGVQDLWDFIWADLNKGQDKDLELLGKWIENVFTRCIRVLTNAAQEARRLAGGAGYVVKGLDTLEQLIADLNGLRDRVMLNWPWKSRPWPALDKAMQQRSRSRVDGPGEDIEDIVRRLNAGGSLIEG